MTVEIIPAVMPYTAEEIQSKTVTLHAYAPCFQLDIMDGKFTEKKTWPHNSDEEWEGLSVPEAAHLFAGTHYEAHLMVVDPVPLATRLVQAGVSRILMHIESFVSSQEAKVAYDTVKAAGAHEVGFAILAHTPMSALDDALVYTDSIQIMSIPKIGYMGQPFDEEAVTKIAGLHAKHPSLVLEADGGVTPLNALSLKEAGATRLTVGSAFTKGDPVSVFNEFQKVLA